MYNKIKLTLVVSVYNEEEVLKRFWLETKKKFRQIRH